MSDAASAARRDVGARGFGKDSVPESDSLASTRSTPVTGDRLRPGAMGVIRPGDYIHVDDCVNGTRAIQTEACAR